MKAHLKTYRQSPRKARLLADLIRGKKIMDAKYALMFADKKSAPVFIKLIDSAAANAKQNFSIESDNLFVKVATVNKGVTMKRSMPRARGSAFPINKRTSHIFVELAVKEPKAKKGEVAVVSEKPLEKKPKSTKKVSSKKEA